ncbi:DNA repair protein RAD51 homolog 3 isoform X1 [Spodoptera frugiperda]|uniref:DNA repair protein RAD51 homolog 3 n=1 Tax=Spodoptera frugiperda TaxID=7108 RepID=A0A9R0DHJ8_SPOFR|nr:DNA repair protein RAD51 homolog 3 isoform X1 [Spodoptera frugiperda]
MKTFKISNATELWQKETSLPAVASFSQSLDNILGINGFQLGSIIELLGLPGAGKTQLCLQLCASVQIPKELGGLNAEALYIDTNTNFTISRFREILSASLLRCQTILGEPLQMTENEALSKLHYVNAFGLEKFCAFMYRLPKFIEAHPNVKLIAIDSIAYPFKDGIPTKQRTGLLFRQMAELQRIAVQHQIAVVLSNEMSTRVGLSGGAVVGSLGDAWAHRCNVRLLLSTPQVTQDSTERLALLLKSNVAASTVARFKITEEGIRDAE